MSRSTRRAGHSKSMPYLKHIRFDGVVDNVYNFLKKPAVWILTTAGAVATTATASFFTDALGPVTTAISQTVCEFRRSKGPEDDGRFKVLVSPFSGDSGGKWTALVINAFRAEIGFRTIPICDHLTFDPLSEVEIANEKAKKRGAELIKTEHADLLLFGELTISDNSLYIWAINELGGCDVRPKPVVFKAGALPREFDEEVRIKLISVSLQEIMAACLHPESINWREFTRRVTKIGSLIEQSESNFPKRELMNLLDRYFDAIYLLYDHDHGEQWFTRGSEIIHRRIDNLPTNTANTERGGLWYGLARLMHSKYEKTRKVEDQHSAILAYDRAIQLDPENHEWFRYRGELYAAVGDYDHALDDFEKAIRLDPKDAIAFRQRGHTYFMKRDYDHAIQFYDEAIKLEPSNAIHFANRAYTFGAMGDLDRAIADYNVAIRLDARYAVAYSNRGTLYVAKGEIDRAVADYSEAIRLNPIANAYVGRGRIFLLTGSFANANADFKRANELSPDPYTALWLDLAERRNDISRHLAEATKQLDMKAWPAPLIRLFLNELNSAEALAAAEDQDPKRQQGQICEANFYSGELALVKGATEEALRFLRLAASDCPRNYIEWGSANFALRELGVVP
jgi:tetratricopeptide (TPR) repeat protein